jgi:hypothetical protein
MAKKLVCASCGGTKKMAKGGSTSSRAINTKGAGYANASIGSTNQSMGIFGTAQAGQGEMDGKTGKMKKGGTVSRAVQPSCKNGYVRGADGKCVKVRPSSFKK